ncbi:hypothetical protein AAHZ94_15400, partial [Streptomyces sp. HSW2009]
MSRPPSAPATARRQGAASSRRARPRDPQRGGRAHRRPSGPHRVTGRRHRRGGAPPPPPAPPGGGGRAPPGGAPGRGAPRGGGGRGGR